MNCKDQLCVLLETCTKEKGKNNVEGGARGMDGEVREEEDR